MTSRQEQRDAIEKLQLNYITALTVLEALMQEQRDAFIKLQSDYRTALTVLDSNCAQRIEDTAAVFRKCKMHLTTLVGILKLIVYCRKDDFLINLHSLMSDFLYITIEAEILQQATLDEIRSPVTITTFSISSTLLFALTKNSHIRY